MIGYLSGKLFFREEQSVVIIVAGVGYRVHLLERGSSAYPLGEDISIYVHTYSRDGFPELYGFVEHEDRVLFEHLISVAGVGPKSALAVLRLASSVEIGDAIVRGDSDMLKKVSGIGSKTAERIVIELKGTLETHGSFSKKNHDSDDIVDALIRLGYPRASAIRAVEMIPSSAETEEEKLRAALKALSL